MGNSEWLEVESKNAAWKDWQIIYLAKNASFLRLYGMTRWRWLAHFMAGMEIKQYKMVKGSLVGGPYNSILAEYIEAVSEVMRKSLNMGNCVVTLDDFGNTEGFDTFNATAFPAFGVNYVSVSSGIFFHSHTLVRTLQPFLMGIQPPRLIAKLLLHNFKKSAIGFLCNDHTRSLHSIRFLFEDDGLLEGVELFIVAHEMYHIVYGNNEQISSVFNSLYSSPVAQLCQSNEEIGADGFGVIILYYHQKETGSSIMPYSPCFLFKLLSLFDDIMEQKNESDGVHPTNKKRYELTAQMLTDLHVKSNIEERSEILTNLVMPLGDRIRKRVNKIIEERAVLSRIHDDIWSVVIADLERKNN